MPKSQVRKKKVYTPPAEVRPASEASRKPSSPWLPATAVAMIVAGITWLVVFYVTTGQFPVESLEYFNLVIGFGLIVGSLGVLSRWH